MLDPNKNNILIDGVVGKLEIAIQIPTEPKGIVLIGHPHPLFQGTMNNKIVTQINRTLYKKNYIVARLNFRGVGQSEGEFDNGHGECLDILALLKHLDSLSESYKNLPIILAGFSFGSYVQTYVQQHIDTERLKRIILVGPAVSRFKVLEVPKNTIIIHGELDDTVPLSDVFEWARPQDLTVQVVTGADHFFHKKLHHIDRILNIEID